MVVCGNEITAEIESAMIDYMKAGPFRGMQLELKAVNLGVPNDGTQPAAMRLADRLIQRERKVGNISYQRVNGEVVWSWKP